ncbi:MAG: MFS transporter [Brevefilum sp.]
MQFNFNRQTKLFLLSTLLYGFSFSVWELFFNLYILSLGFNNDMLGLIRSATPLSALLLGLPLGLLSDRIGRRTSMIIGLIIGFSGMLLQIRLLYTLLIFFFGFVQGAGFMLYHVSQSPFIMATSREENQAMIFSLNFGLLTVAAMIGSLTAGQMPDLLARTFGIVQGSAASYQWVITAGILMATTSLVPIFMLPKDRRTNHQTPLSKPSLKEMLEKLIGRRLVRRLTLINLFMGLGAAILIPYLNVFLRNKFAIQDELLGLIFSLSSLLVFLGSMITPWLVKITKSRIVPTVATQGASIVFLFSLGFSPILWIAAVSMLLRTVLMQMSIPLLENFAMLLSQPEEQAAISSIRAIGWQMGQAIGIFISGLVQTRFGFSPLFITTGIMYAISVLLTWVYFRPGEKEMAHAG